MCCSFVDDFDEVRFVSAVILDPLQHFGVDFSWINGIAIVCDRLQIRLPQALPLFDIRVSLPSRHCRLPSHDLTTLMLQRRLWTMELRIHFWSH
jgi:hypothetical protein